jgi:hypothetical protein
MAGCNDDIILRKDNVICDKGSGISLKDFVNKLIAQYLAENPSTGGSGGSGGSASLFVSASDQSGTAGEIALPNSGQPLIIKSTRADIAVTRSGNQIIIGNPPAACSPVASPTIATFTLDVTELEIGTNKSTFVPTFTTTTPSGSPSSTPGVAPCPTTVASSWTSFQIVATPPSGNQTFSGVTSGTSRNFTTALTFTAPGQTCTFTLSGTGLKSDSTSATASATATITAKFKIFTGYLVATKDSNTVVINDLTAISGLKTNINGSYGSTGHPGGSCYFYFAIPAALNITTAYLGSQGFSFLGTSGNGYTTLDTYNNGDGITYTKTITYSGINYALYRSNQATSAAFGNILIT